MDRSRRGAIAGPRVSAP
ncbi:hypothetical protein, partial [Burkholderia pseudomallei]